MKYYFWLLLLYCFSCNSFKNKAEIISTIKLKVDSCGNYFLKLHFKNISTQNYYLFPPNMRFKNLKDSNESIFKIPGYYEYNAAEKKYVFNTLNTCIQGDVLIVKKKILNSIDTTSLDLIEKDALNELLFLKSGQEYEYYEFIGNNQDVLSLSGKFYHDINMTKKFTGIKYLPKTLGGYQLFLDEIKSDTLRVELY